MFSNGNFEYADENYRNDFLAEGAFPSIETYNKLNAVEDGSGEQLEAIEISRAEFLEILDKYKPLKKE